MYTRVIPRDLFNESKLLKCLGQLALHIHHGVIEIEIQQDGPFVIDQRRSDGGLYVSRGLYFLLNGRVLDLYTAYNSKESYPLLCMMKDEEISVLNEDGSLSDEFVKYVKGK